MKVVFEFEVGEGTRCYIEKNSPCRFLQVYRMGTIPVCSLFNKDLQEDPVDYTIQKCEECIKRFG